MFTAFPVFSKEKDNGVVFNNCVNKYCISKSTAIQNKMGLKITVFNSINDQSFWLVENRTKNLCFFKKNKYIESKPVHVDYCLKLNSLFANSK